MLTPQQLTERMETRTLKVDGVYMLDEVWVKDLISDLCDAFVQVPVYNMSDRNAVVERVNDLAAQFKSALE